MGEPTTRSFTVPDTSTLPSPASAMTRAAIELAGREGALAIEGWPVAGSDRQSPDAFLGREKVFEDLGFSCVERPSPQRAIMRLELSGI